MNCPGIPILPLSNVPVRYKLRALFLPGTGQVGESSLIQYCGNGGIDLMPNFSEWVVPVVAGGHLDVFNRAQNITDRNSVRRSRQQITAFGAAPRIHKAALL